MILRPASTDWLAASFVAVELVPKLPKKVRATYIRYTKLLENKGLSQQHRLTALVSSRNVSTALVLTTFWEVH